MGFILITIIIIAGLAMFSRNKTKKSAMEQRKFERKMEKEFNTGKRESSSQEYRVDLAESWSPEQDKKYS